MLNSIADTEDFILDNDVAVIGLFQEEDIAAHKKFLAVAESDLKLPYGVSFNVKVRRVLAQGGGTEEGGGGGEMFCMWALEG